MSAARRAFGVGLLIATVAAVLFFAVLPTRALLEQRSATDDRETELDQIALTNADLELAIAALSTAEEIERIARRDFSLVYPGEEAYAVLPAPPRSVTLPSAWPFSSLPQLLE